MGKISPFEILGETYTNAFRWARYLLPIALVPACIGAVMNAYLMEVMYGDLEMQQGALPEGFWSTWAVVMIVIVSIQLVQMSLFAAVMDDREGWLRFGFVRAMRRLIPALIGMVIFLLAYIVGGMLLVIPGIMAMFLLGMMLPLILLDGTGPFEAIGKSWRLTWGNAWRLFGAAILVSVPMMLVFWPAGIALGFLALDPQELATMPLPTWTQWQTWVWALLTSISGMLMTTFYLTAFKALKAAKVDDGEAESGMVPA